MPPPFPGKPACFIDRHGCAKNQVDTETMMAALDASGWRVLTDPEDAAVIIVNSCGFIESAKRESIDAVLAWRQQFPEKKIILAGCLARRYAAELAESLTEADVFFGGEDPAGIAGAAALLAAPVPVAAPAAWPAPGDRPLLSMPGSAYVKIADGCDNHCSFCAIPLIRGPLRSRPAEEVAAECARLLERGVRELCLVGQDSGAWGRDLGLGLMDLLERLAALPGHFWVRILYIHPDHFPLSLLDLCARDRRFLPYFDIPFQHGSTAVLRAMGRQGTAEKYLELAGAIRAALPDAAIRSTFLAGFPGETAEDFRALLDFQERAALDWAGAFAFSREEGTPAWGMKNRVPKKTALARKREIEERQEIISMRRLDGRLGQRAEVLVEEKIEGEEGFYLGRLPCQAPEVDGLTVISPDGDLEPGRLYEGAVFARAGIDLELRIG